MLISYNWLRELTGTALTPEELRERLTMVGLAIDAIEQHNGDFVLDVEVPSNRPDCLSHVGIAREVAVIESGAVKMPAEIPIKATLQATDSTSVEILDPDLCPRYAARLIRNVKIAPSPAWLANRLEEIGQRPINNVADVTNYVLHELGQPLHAFDFAKLDGHRIVVRRARAGEKLQTLDAVTRELTQDMLVIADAVKPVALAGIMGGEDSEISNQTVDVLIESAHFNPDSVRRTARQLGMDTEASRRFERGADCENVLRAQARCVELICEIAGGEASKDAIDVYPDPVETRVVRFRPTRVEALTSISTSEMEMLRILTALGFVAETEQAEAIEFIVPSWRVDVSIEEDLVEEVARHTGYDKIGSALPPANMAGEYQPNEPMRRSWRRALVGLGFDEAINFSFIAGGAEDHYELLPFLASASASAFGFVELRNPIIEEANVMRPTLLPGLLDSMRLNLNHGNKDLRLFEIGRIFARSNSGDLPVEREAAALVAMGGALNEGVAQAPHEIDFSDIKGTLEAAIDAMKLRPLTFSPAAVKHLRVGQSATLSLADGVPIGTIGRLSETLTAAYKFRQPVFVAELDLTALLSSKERAVQYQPLPRYPAVVRDLSLLVDRKVTLDELFDLIQKLQPTDYRSAKFVGTYEGANIPEGRRSVTLRIEYRSDERTLRDEEVEERHRALVESLVRNLGAEQH
jgi:phenylalanyl-tRNA synthetase beta chain